MREPYLGIYIADDAVHFFKKLPTEDSPRNIFEVDIADVVADEFDAAAARLGGTVLGILRLWHENKFSAWGKETESSSHDSNDAFGTATYLINRFSKGCSEDRLILIDELLNEAALDEPQAKEFLDESWPFLRNRLGELGRSKK